MTQPRSAPSALPEVQGRCPACSGSSLFLGDGGYITCSRIDCPVPDAASTLLWLQPDASDLRQQVAAAIALYDHAVGQASDPAPRDHHYGQADAVLAVRDREVERLRQRLALADHIHQENAATIERFRARIQSAADEARGSMRDWLVDALADSADPREPSTAQTFREQAARAKAALERVQAECDRIEAAVRANPTDPDFDGAYLAAIGHIRRALNPQEKS